MKISFQINQTSGYDLSENGVDISLRIKKGQGRRGQSFFIEAIFVQILGKVYELKMNLQYFVDTLWNPNMMAQHEL